MASPSKTVIWNPSDEIIETLGKLRRDIRYAQYRADLLERATTLRKALPQSPDPNSVLWLKALCAIAEVYDYYGMYEQSNNLLTRAGLTLSSELAHWDVPETEIERASRKQKIWLLIDYAQVLYRDHRHAFAIAILNDCQNKIERFLRQGEHHYNSTLARIYFIRGQCQRQEANFGIAEESFTQAIEFSYKAVLARKQAAQRSGRHWERRQERYREEQALATHRLAMILATGLGWMAYTQGAISRAQGYVRSARVLIEPSEDWVHKAYIELLSGCLERSSAGLDKKKLADAITTVTAAYKVFRERSHIYHARAAYELALAHTYNGEYDLANDYVDESLVSAEKSNDHRWICNASVVRSRIERRRGDPARAIEIADQVLQAALQQKLSLCVIDALIARGEALFDQNEIAKATDDFEEARRRSGDNLKIRAVCSLHLARSFVIQNRLAEAERAWAAWAQVKRFVEHQLIHALASQVRDSLDSQAADFQLLHTEPDLTATKHIHALCAHLVRQVEKRYKHVNQRAKALGVTRQTYHNWKRGKYPGPKKRDS